MRSLRLFLAFNLPVEVKEMLAAIQDRFKDSYRGVKWVEKDNLHLTIRFLGETEFAKIPGLIGAVRGAVENVAPFCVRLGRAGVFPSRGDPKVLWVSLEEDDGNLGIIRDNIEKAVSELGYLPEKRRFRPHITLARIRSCSKATLLSMHVRELWNSFTNIKGIRVDSVELMQSELNRSGPIYTVLERIRFLGKS